MDVTELLNSRIGALPKKPRYTIKEIPKKYKKARIKETFRTCYGCKHTWHIRKLDEDGFPVEPKRCPNCKSFKWNNPDVIYEFLKDPDRMLTTEELMRIRARDKRLNPIIADSERLLEIKELASELYNTENHTTTNHIDIGVTEYVVRAMEIYDKEHPTK